MAWVGRISAAMLAVGVAAAPALAADLTSEQAQALDGQLRGWMGNLVGPGFDAGKLNLHITAEGDHYRVELPLPGDIGATGASVSGAAITAQAKPLDGGVWSIDDIQMPSPIDVSAPQLTVAGDKTVPHAMHITFGEQKNHASFDPSLASPSTFDGQISSFSETGTSALGETKSSIAHIYWHNVWQPGGGGLVNMQGTGELDGYDSTQPLPGGTVLDLAIDKIAVTSQMTGTDFASFGNLIHEAVALASEHAAAKADPAPAPATAPATTGAPAPAAAGPTPEQRAILHKLVDTLGALFTSADTDYKMTGLRFTSGPQKGSIAALEFASGYGAPGGRADMHMKLVVDGFDSTAVPPGVWRDYLPKHVELAPRISGIPQADLVAALQRMIDQPNDAKPGMAMMTAMGEGQMLLAKGPLVVGLDSLALDLGPATLTGKGALTVASMADIHGGATILATGLDALIQKASQTPEMKQALPMLIMLKGIGKPSGASMEWDVLYANNKVTVNGTDLAGMTPH
ncbi:MAG: hypothetical protein KGJ41_05530 [Rhodospirillales bacterium]|nr:hypothetical protein [Rhodospirillales bacterium]